MSPLLVPVLSESPFMRLPLTPFAHPVIFFIALAASLLTGLVLAPQSKAAYSSTPRILSQADIETYRAIFTAQEKSKWQLADKKIEKLENDLLLGHVLHQRYMHPTGWRSSYKELSSWLRLYSDHPQAEEIYRLARKRRPSGAKVPRYQPRQWRTQTATHLHPDVQNQTLAVRRIEGKIRYHCAEDEPTQALNYLQAKRQRSQLTAAQYDRMRSWIAESYYYNERITKARTIAEDVARRHPEQAPMALWVAGLIAWRDGDFNRAADYFSRQALLEWQDDEMRSAAAFWAARAALAAGRGDEIIPNLNIAADYPFSFYGQLAIGQLGQKIGFNWQSIQLDDEGWQTLLKASPRIRRAIALTQIGEIDRAQQELRWAHGEIASDMDFLLIAASEALKLPSASVTMALASNAEASPGSPMDHALYPVPEYAPNGGFTIDRAILFGLIRQESKFMTKANSRAGARGLMQLMPRTASYVAGDRSLRYRSQGKRLYDPAYNMQLGQSYVDYLLKGSAHGDLFDMALSYNWGPGNLRRFKNRTGIEDQLLLLESIPNREARNFVEQVMSNIWVYRARLGQPAPSRDNVAAGGRPIYQSLER